MLKRLVLNIFTALSPLLIVAIVAACQGCNYLLRGARVPQNEGTWTGRVVSITMYDRAGKAYDALGFEIEKGPQLRFSIIAELGSGKLPILVKVEDDDTVIIEPSEMEVGRRFQVTGLTYEGFAEVSRSRANKSIHLSRRQEATTAVERLEHILIVKRAKCYSQ